MSRGGPVQRCAAPGVSTAAGGKTQGTTTTASVGCCTTCQTFVSTPPTPTIPSPLLAAHCMQALSNITAAYGTRLLGDKQPTEASLGIKDSLCAAAAVHTYRRPQVCCESADLNCLLQALALYMQGHPNNFVPLAAHCRRRQRPARAAA